MTPATLISTSETRPALEADSVSWPLIRELEAKYADLWWSTDDDTPLIGEPVGRQRQRENAKETECFLNELAHQVEQYPDSERDRFEWRERRKEEIRRFGEQHLGWPEGYRSLLFADAFYDSTSEFVRKARDFDKRIQAEDVGQALRNVWIMNSIQMLLDMEVGFSPAIFAYSMLYPYTDNYLDDPKVAEESKKRFNRKLGLRLAGEKVKALDNRQEDVFRLIDLIESQYPRTRFPEVYRSLMAIHRAQVNSLIQQRRDRPPDEHASLKLSIAKGGASVLTDGFLAAGTPSRTESDFCFGYGVFLQLLDDLQDVRADARARHTTLFTLSAAKSNLDRITGRLHRFMDRVLASSSRFASPRFDDRKDLILRNCTFLLVGAVSEHHNLFTRSYLQKLESCWPLDFASMRKLDRLARKKCAETTRALLRKKKAESFFELL
jgi:hypothetical protein